MNYEGILIPALFAITLYLSLDVGVAEGVGVNDDISRLERIYRGPFKIFAKRAAEKRLRELRPAHMAGGTGISTIYDSRG